MKNNMGRMITRLGRKSQRYIGNALRKYEITAAEQPFFMALQHHDGATQEELTSIVCVDKAATARAVKSMEEKGLLFRVQDENDRRQNRVHLTERGKALISAVNGELQNFNRQLTLDIDPEQLELVREILLQMERNLEEEM